MKIKILQTFTIALCLILTVSTSNIFAKESYKQKHEPARTDQPVVQNVVQSDQVPIQCVVQTTAINEATGLLTPPDIAALSKKDPMLLNVNDAAPNNTSPGNTAAVVHKINNSASPGNMATFDIAMNAPSRDGTNTTAAANNSPGAGMTTKNTGQQSSNYDVNKIGKEKDIAVPTMYG